MPEPNHPKTLKLTKPWGGNPAGTKFTVLGPGEDPTPGKVDPARAATLLYQQLAVEIGAEPNPAKPVKQKEA